MLLAFTYPESQALVGGSTERMSVEYLRGYAGFGAARLTCHGAGAYTLPLFRSTWPHFYGYVECMIFPQSIRQGDTGR